MFIPLSFVLSGKSPSLIYIIPSCWMRWILKYTKRLYISLLIYTDGFPLISELAVSPMSTLHSLYYRNCYCNKSECICAYTLRIVQMQKACSNNYVHMRAQWFCQDEERLAVAGERAIIVVLGEARAAHELVFPVQHVIVGGRYQEKAQIRDKFSYFWTFSDFCFFPFLASFPPFPTWFALIPYPHLPPPSLLPSPPLHLSATCFYRNPIHLFSPRWCSLLPVAWHRLGSFKLNWITQRSSDDISRPPSTTALTSTLFSSFLRWAVCSG